MIAKFEKARKMKGGTRFLHVFASCPTGWGIPSEMSVKIARLAVQTNIFPLYEVENGTDYTLNYQGDRPAKEYLEIQGRFKHLTDQDFQQVQDMVAGRRKELNNFLASSDIDQVELRVDQDYVRPLTKFFRMRARRR